METLKHLFYRFHPVTGADANDFPSLTIEQREEIAAMIRNGARFYWEKTSDSGEHVVEGYCRVEYGNVKFVLDVAREPYEFRDHRPS